MAGDERAGGGPEVVDLYGQGSFQEMQAAVDLDEEGFADQVSQNAPRRLTSVIGRRAGTFQGLNQGEQAPLTADCLADARRRRGEGTQFGGKELAEGLRAGGGRGVKVGHATDSAYRVIGAEAIGVDGDDIPARAEGQGGPGRELDGHQPKQGREPGVRAVLDLQSLQVAGDIGVDQWLPGRRWDGGLVSRD